MVSWRKSPAMKAVIPDRIEPMIGWRFWRLRWVDALHPSACWLESPVVPNAAWQARTVFRSRCKRCDRAPSFGCRCGIHAFHPGPFFEDGVPASRRGRGWADASDGLCVVGQVRGWGWVVEHCKGWRAERAYPQSLALVCGACLTEDGALRRADLLGWWSASFAWAGCDGHQGGREETIGATHIMPAAAAEELLCGYYGVVRALLPGELKC